MRCRDGRRAERVADVGIGPGLGEDQAADRAVAQHERPATVAALDLRAQLEDLPADRGLVVDVAAGRGVGAGHGGRHDREAAAARIAQRRPDRTADRLRVG